jgi:ribose 5-phosphate isomerase B
MRIALAADHAGFALKDRIKAHLAGRGMDVDDFGTDSADSVDYPDYGRPAAEAVAAGKDQLGVLICGSGEGMCMVANKVAGVRAALAWEPEVARLSRLHNDANVLCLPGRFVDERSALAIVDAWLAAAFEGGRHARRVEKMMRHEREGRE